MRKIIMFIVLCLFLVGCVENDLPPEPEMFSGVGQATGVLPDWASDPGTKFTTTNPLIFENEIANLNAEIKGDEYVYKFGYLYANQEWQIFEFDENVISGSNWIEGDAGVAVEALRSQTPDGQYFVVAYSCSKVSDAWDCNGNKWMLQNFMVKQAECATGTTKCVGDTSFSECINGVWSVAVSNCEFGDTCSNGVCGTTSTGTAVATCEDGVKNQDETSVDCGGSCSGCPMGSDCLISNDCLSAYCGQNECKAYFECIDSDGGQKFDVKGAATGVSFDITEPAEYNDVCNGNILYEYYCLGNDVAQVNETCEYGCGNGACNAQPLCTDTDSGKNYNVKGTSCMGTDCSTDVCQNNEDLTEYFCSSEYDTGVETYACPYGCSNGVCTAQPPGLLAYWKLDDNLQDSIGTNNGGGIASYSTGFSDKAYEFTGNVFIGVPNNNALDIIGKFSLSFWMKSDDLTNNEPLFDKRSTGNVGWQLRQVVGYLQFQLFGDASGPFINSYTLQNNIWYHVTITLDRDVSQGLKIYVNGDLQRTSDATSYQNVNLNNAEGLNIGYSEMAGFSNFNGLLDEIKIYNKILTPAEVQGNFDSYTVVTCSDNIKNQDETDVDCGGSCSANCVNGKSCSSAADCTSNNCVSGVCAAAYFCTDSDGGQNPNVKGTATSTGEAPRIDSCSSSSRLLEVWCRTSTSYRPEGYYVDCPYGCVNGACQTQPAPVWTNIGSQMKSIWYGSCIRESRKDVYCTEANIGKKVFYALPKYDSDGYRVELNYAPDGIDYGYHILLSGDKKMASLYGGTGCGSASGGASEGARSKTVTVYECKR